MVLYLVLSDLHFPSMLIYAHTRIQVSQPLGATGLLCLLPIARCIGAHRSRQVVLASDREGVCSLPNIGEQYSDVTETIERHLLHHAPPAITFAALCQ